jgi:vesicular inhibitory amino acid transporter
VLLLDAANTILIVPRPLNDRLVPLVFLPLSMLSYTSMFGICSTLLIILVIVIDGFSKPDAPGSLWSPAATSWGTGSTTELGVAFGLLELVW